jgi:hypothetical protein
LYDTGASCLGIPDSDALQANASGPTRGYVPRKLAGLIQRNAASLGKV